MKEDGLEERPTMDRDLDRLETVARELWGDSWTIRVNSVSHSGHSTSLLLDIKITVPAHVPNGLSEGRKAPLFFQLNRTVVHWFRDSDLLCFHTI
jgi:hypothetical protein